MDQFIKSYGIGLTGGIATGKSTVGKILTEIGFTVIDADLLSRRAVSSKSECLAQLVNIFSSKILDHDGELNRRHLRQIILKDDLAKEQLEKILHPKIRGLLVEDIKRLDLESQKLPWFYEASLIFETQQHTKFSEIWLTICSEESQVRRVIERDQTSRTEAQKIIQMQMPTHKKQQLADQHIITDCSRKTLKARVQELAKRLIKNEKS